MRRKLTIITIILLIVLGLYILNFPSLLYDLKRVASNPEEIVNYIQSFGIWGPMNLILIQIVQVVISPIPGSITSLAAGALYGIFWGFLLNVLGIFLGSLAAFYLARLFGKPLVIKIIGKKSYYKYSKIVSEKYTIGLFILFFVPFFPDDALCLLAGMSTMPISIFLFFVLVGRAPGLFVATLVGSGNITLSLPIWIILGIISILIIVISLKYNNKIEGFIIKKVEIQRKRYEKVKLKTKAIRRRK